MELSLSPLSRQVNVDGMLSIVGEFGPFQWFVELLLCIMMVPRTFQILLMYFVALNPSWKCVTNSSICLLNGTMESTNNDRCSMPREEWEFTEPKEFSIVTQFEIYCGNEWQIYLTTSIFFIGSPIGGIINGWLSDRFGRKKILFPNLFGNMLFGLIAAFMPSIYPFLLCRFLIGFFSPGAGIQIFIMASEMVGSKYRPTAGIMLWLFFTLALCILGLKAYFIRTWKNLMIVCTAPYYLVMLFWFLIPESVRWLHLHGKIEKAEKIFKRIAKRNKREYPIHTTLSVPNTEDIEHKSNVADLFRTRRLATLTAIQACNWFTNAMVYYGISLAADDLGGSLYRNYVLVSAIEFPAGLLAIYLSGRIGRKKSTMIPMLLGSIACIIIAFIPAKGSAKIARVAFGMLGKLCITISFDAIYTWSLEIYPTTHRGNAMGLLDIASRLGGAASPWVAKGLKTLHESVPFIVMGVSAFISACFLAFLPETKDKFTCESIEDKEKIAEDRL